jgi:hypothetical protein
MKRLGFALVFLMMNLYLFSQSDVMRFLSLGFNTEGTSHFFFGFEGYSEALLIGPYMQLYIGDGLFYSWVNISQEILPTKFSFSHGLNNTIALNWNLIAFGVVGQIQRFENNRLVYWAWTEGYRGPTTTILESIEQSEERIIITVRSVDDPARIFRLTYHNIPANEVLDLFYRRYIQLICSVVEMVNITYYANDISNVVSLVLQGRTARELAIFRNTLFAMRGLRFQTQAWTDFFTQHLAGYNGRYTSDEVIAMFTENEYWLLNVIIQHENRL